MSFADWVKNGWLVAHKSSKQETANLLGIMERHLKDSLQRMCLTVFRSYYIIIVNETLWRRGRDCNRCC